MQQSTVLVTALHTCQSLEGSRTLAVIKTVVPLAIFCAVSRIVIAAGYARPLTADINGVMPLASLGKKNPNRQVRIPKFFHCNRRSRMQIHKNSALLSLCKQKKHRVNKQSCLFYFPEADILLKDGRTQHSCILTLSILTNRPLCNLFKKASM